MEGENWFESAYQDMPRRNGVKAMGVKCVPHLRKKLANKIHLSIGMFSKTTKENVKMHDHSKVIWGKKEAFAGPWIEMVFISDIVSEYLV